MVYREKSSSERSAVSEPSATIGSGEHVQGPREIAFVKTQSVGNDFVLVHEKDFDPQFSEAERAKIFERLAIQASDRRLGVGSDGLLVLGSKGADVTLRMFNPDGTEDFCGNGLRCAAICAREEGLIGSNSFVIVHKGQRVETELLGANLVRTKLGRADYTPKNVPVISGRELFKETIWSGMIDGMPLSFFGSALTTGSTHVVIPTVNLPDEESFVSISSSIEKDPKFPEHTSVIWTKETEPMRLQIRIWERGAGETQGCGTGSSAAAADYLRRRGKGGTVIVINPGGPLSVSMDAWDAPISAEGDAEITYTGTFRVGPNP